MAVCPKCGTQVPNNLAFCTECGCNLSEPVLAKTNDLSPAKEKHSHPGRGTNVLFVCIGVLFLACAVIGTLLLTGVLGSGKEYSQAMDLYKQGQLEEAAVLFDQLGDYKNSAEMANTCRYQQAQNAYLRYDLALTLFQDLGDYRDSADWVERCEAALKNPAVGTWEIRSMTSGEETLSVDEVPALKNYIVIELKADGTGTITSGGETLPLTWDDATITVEGDPANYKVSGDELTITSGQLSFVLARR